MLKKRHFHKEPRFNNLDQNCQVEIATWQSFFQNMLVTTAHSLVPISQ